MKNSSNSLRTSDNVDNLNKPSSESAVGSSSSFFGSTKPSRFFDSSERSSTKSSGTRTTGNRQSTTTPSQSANLSSSNSSRVLAGHRQPNSSPPRSSSSHKPHQHQSGSSRYSSSQTQSSYYSSSNTGSAGGGNMSSSGSSNLSKIVVAQVFLLASTMKEDKYESQAAQIRQLCEQNGMEVYTKLIRRLIQGNSPTIFPASSQNKQVENATNYRLLNEEIQKAVENLDHARNVAESISGSDDGIFKDFDLTGFMRHFSMDALDRSVFALGFKNSPKADLRSKAHEIITNSFNPMLEILSNPNKHARWDPALIAFFLKDYYSDPLPSFFDNNAKLSLSYAARVRFANSTIPDEIQRITESIEKMRAQESLTRLFTIAGSHSTTSLEACRDVLKRKWRVELGEEEVSDLLAVMATSQHPRDWNPEIFITAIQEENLGESFDWNLVLEHLDRPDFIIKDPDGLLLLINGLLVAAEKSESLEISRLWAGKWKNPAAQLSVLKALTSRSLERFDLNKVPNLKRIVTADQFADAPASLSALAATYENQKLNSVDAVQALIYLSTNATLAADVKEDAGKLLDRHWKLVPELLLTGAFIAPRPWSEPYEGIVNRLFVGFFEGHPSRHLVFFLLWNANKATVIERFISFYSVDQLNLSKIVDISNDLQITSELTQAVPFELALDIACLASARDGFELEKWCLDMISRGGKPFVDTILLFLEAKSSNDYDFQPAEQKKQKVSETLRVAEVSVLLEVTDKSSSLLSFEQRDFVVSVQRKCLQSYPRLINLHQGHDDVIFANSKNGNTFTPSVDKRMQDYYQKMYGNEITIKKMVEDLQKFKTSDVPEDQDLFSCMIHSLFDEYSCYPTYPNEPLATTAVLFGALIEFRLLDGLALNVALGMVLDALQKHQPRDNMFKFGLQALKHFPNRLREWKGFCNHLASISALQGTDVMDIALEVLSSQEARQSDVSNGVSETNGSAFGGDAAGSPNLPNGSLDLQPPPPAAFRALRLDPLPREDHFEEPSEETQDKVLFIVNNLTASNLDVKLKEFNEYMKDAYHQWFADYLVVQRARTEPNNHKLYLDFLEGFNSKSLLNQVLRETYRNAFSLLNSESVMNSATERSHLKHLGGWLGGLTIAKDKPIKHNNIAFRDLLVEGYDTQRLIVVLPFTCKILEQATKSSVFKPPNPWIMAIIQLLAELYHYADLKLNLKFEIEVLCGSLNLDIKDIEPATQIRNRPPEIEEHDRPFIDPIENIFHNREDSRQEQFTNLSIPNFQEQLQYNNSLSSFFHYPGFKNILRAGIDRAVREIISPVVERSVTIASISTAQLILKDFAMEPNEEKMKKAAHSMVQTMAGSLALVTCKEPLRMSMSNTIRQLLSQAGYGEQTVPDQAIQSFVNDNLEVSSAVIQKAAQDKSIPEIDENLQQAYAARKAHRDRRTNIPFTDPTMSRYVMTMPEPFRLKAGGLTPAQLNVYDDFSRMPRATSEIAAGPRLGQELSDFMQAPEATMHLPQAIATQQLPPPQSHHTQQQQQQQQLQQRQAAPLQPSAISRPTQPTDLLKSSKDRMTELLVELGRLLKEASEQSMADLPDTHQIKLVMTEVLRLVAQSPFRDTLSTNAAQNICSLLFLQLEDPLEVEGFVTLLEKLCQLSSVCSKEVHTWLVSQDDDRMFNVPVTVMLVKSRLLSLSQVDVTISRAIESRKQTAIEFLANLIRQTVLNQNPIAMRSDFASSLNGLMHHLQQDPQNEIAHNLLDELQRFESPPQIDQESEEKLQREQLAYVFEEWIQLYNHPATNDKAFVAFVSQLHQNKVFDDYALSALFFKTSVEMCIEMYAKDVALSENALASSLFIPIDSLAKLIILLVKYQFEEQAENPSERPNQKADYLNSILSVLVLVFNNQHENRGMLFNQKIFFRLFSSLFCEYHVVESQLQAQHAKIMRAFHNTLLAIQPMYYPGFAFAWTALVSHRHYMPKIIYLDNQGNRNLYVQELEVLLKYLGRLLKYPDLNEDQRQFYRGVLRVMLVLHHDFPDFLAEYHYLICDVIPSHCTQLRNLILSAFPMSLSELPDPFTQGLKVDRLPEIRVPPPIAGDVTGTLKRAGIKEAIDTCLSGDISSEKVKRILDAVTIDPRRDVGLGFSVVSVNPPILNAIALYIAMDAISKSEQSGDIAYQRGSDHSKLFLQMAMDFPPEARYFLLSAIANQLRYPNCHTHYFSCTILFLFAHDGSNPNEMDLRQQITRVLLERLIVHRPHPWGLIITLLELLKNPIYEFWNLSFIKSAPEIERLFDALFQHVNTDR